MPVDANRKCAMCGRYSGYMKYCDPICKNYFHHVRRSNGSYRDLIIALLQRGREGLMLRDSVALDRLQSFNWLTRIAPDTYKLSAHGYRAIEMMYGDSIGEAS